VALICVDETTVKSADASPNMTASAPARLVPEIVTAVPPLAGPLLGLSEVTDGVSAVLV
jgi:hypothetical protein